MKLSPRLSEMVEKYRPQAAHLTIPEVIDLAEKQGLKWRMGDDNTLHLSDKKPLREYLPSFMRRSHRPPGWDWHPNTLVVGPSGLVVSYLHDTDILGRWSVIRFVPYLGCNNTDYGYISSSTSHQPGIDQLLLGQHRTPDIQIYEKVIKVWALRDQLPPARPESLGWASPLGQVVWLGFEAEIPPGTKPEQLRYLGL